MTNGDRIRKMSDNELAGIITCPYYADPETCIRETTCVKCCAEWLAEEADG